MSNYQHERGWLDSDVWGEEPYDERSAWSWMIGEAAFAERTVSVNGIPMTLERGQLTASLRFMADKWHWKGKGGKDKVRRFLDKLERWKMIASATDRATAQTIITICNYNKYQDKCGASATDRATPPRHPRDSDATPTRQTINPSNPLKEKKEKQEKEKKPPPEDPDNPIWFDLHGFRLTKRDFHAWLDQTVLTSDQLFKYLAQRVQWLQDNRSTESRRNWFLSTLKDLKNRHGNEELAL